MQRELSAAEWRAYFSGDPVNKARVAALEDVSLDGMYMTNRARFSARLKQAYGDVPMTMGVDDQVINVLRQWLHNGSMTPELLPVQRAWLSWVIYDSQLSDIVNLEAKGTLTRENVQLLLNATEQSSTSGPDIGEYEKRQEERYKDFRLKGEHCKILNQKWLF